MSTSEVTKVSNASLKNLFPLVGRYIPGTLLPMILTLLSTIIFTRAFSTSDYGQYSLFATLVTLIVAVSSQWLQQATNRFLPGASEYEQRTIKNSVLLGLIVVGLFVIALGGIVVSILHLSNIKWPQLATATLFDSIFSILYNELTVIIQAEMKGYLFSVIGLTYSISKILLSLLLVFIVHRSPSSLLWADAFSYILVIPLLWILTNMHRVQVFNHIAEYFTQMWKLLQYGFPMTLWFLTSIVLNIGDRYVIQYYKGFSAAGIYSANYSLVSGAISLLSSPILLAAHPFMMRAWNEGNRELASKWLAVIIEWFLSGGLWLVGGVFLTEHSIAGIFLGNSFRLGANIMPIVLAGLIFWQASLYSHKPFEFQGKTIALSLISLASVIVNLLLNIVFVRSFGYIGSAWITLLSFVFYFGISTIFGQRLLTWKMNWVRVSKSLFPSFFYFAGLRVLQLYLSQVLNRGWATIVILCIWVPSIPMYIWWLKRLYKNQL